MRTNRKTVSGGEGKEFHLLIHRVSRTWLSKWAEKGDNNFTVFERTFPNGDIY